MLRARIVTNAAVAETKNILSSLISVIFEKRSFRLDRSNGSVGIESDVVVPLDVPLLCEFLGFVVVCGFGAETGALPVLVFWAAAEPFCVGGFIL